MRLYSFAIVFFIISIVMATDSIEVLLNNIDNINKGITTLQYTEKEIETTDEIVFKNFWIKKNEIIYFLEEAYGSFDLEEENESYFSLHLLYTPEFYIVRNLHDNTIPDISLNKREHARELYKARINNAYILNRYKNNAKIVFASDEENDDYKMWVVEVIFDKNMDENYSRKILKFDKNSGLIVIEETYDLENNLMDTKSLSDIKINQPISDTYFDVSLFLDRSKALFDTEKINESEIQKNLNEKLQYAVRRATENIMSFESAHYKLVFSDAAEIEVNRINKDDAVFILETIKKEDSLESSKSILYTPENALEVYEENGEKRLRILSDENIFYNQKRIPISILSDYEKTGNTIAFKYTESNDIFSAWVFEVKFDQKDSEIARKIMKFEKKTGILVHEENYAQDESLISSFTINDAIRINSP